MQLVRYEAENSEKESEKLLIKNWKNSKDAYAVRYGINLLMRFYLDDLFCGEHLELVAAVKSDEYYINMMQAWYIEHMPHEGDRAFSFCRSGDETYLLRYNGSEYTHIELCKY